MSLTQFSLALVKIYEPLLNYIILNFLARSPPPCSIKIKKSASLRSAQYARKLADLKADDGRCMALMLTNKNKKDLQRVEDRLAEFCERNTALKEFMVTTFPQVKLLLQHVLKNVVVEGNVGEGAERARKTISQ